MQLRSRRSGPTGFGDVVVPTAHCRTTKIQQTRSRLARHRLRAPHHRDVVPAGRCDRHRRHACLHGTNHSGEARRLVTGCLSATPVVRWRVGCTTGRDSPARRPCSPDPRSVAGVLDSWRASTWGSTSATRWQATCAETRLCEQQCGGTDELWRVAAGARTACQQTGSGPVQQAVGGHCAACGGTCLPCAHGEGGVGRATSSSATD